MKQTKLTTEAKAMMIDQIISFLKRGQAEKNKHLLASEGMHIDQVSFDAGDMFFTLAFISDIDLLKIWRMI